MKLSFLRGQVSITTTIIGSVGVILASAFTAWATSSNNVAMVKEQVSVVQERESNHYEEVQKQLDGIDAKLDRLLNQ